MPSIPMLLFVSNGTGTGFNRESWLEIQNDFVNSLENGNIIEIDSSHYMHSIEYEKIAEQSKRFIENL